MSQTSIPPSLHPSLCLSIYLLIHHTHLKMFALQLTLVFPQVLRVNASKGVPWALCGMLNSWANTGKLRVTRSIERTLPCCAPTHQLLSLGCSFFTSHKISLTSSFLV